MNEILLFVHIPKTAGTTFAAILDRNFPSSRIINIYMNFGISVDGFHRLPDRIKNDALCIKGHFDYGLHSDLQRSFRYLTFLRDPVEQVRSRYNHALASRHHLLHRMVSDGMSLADFAVKSPSDYQTRTLAGLEPVNGRHPDLRDEDLQTVKANIEKHFGVVGITERFEESVVLIKRRYGLVNIHYVDRNVRRKGGHREPLSESIRTVVEERNRYDLELYEWARDRFENAIESEGSSFQAELTSFRESNASYSRRMLPFDRIMELAVKGARFARYRLLRR